MSTKYIIEDSEYDITNVSQKKIGTEFVMKYVIIMLIPWVIFRIIMYASEKATWNIQMNSQFALSDFNTFCNATKMLSYKTLIASIVLSIIIAVIAVILILSIVRKYKIKKSYKKKMLAYLYIPQLIVASVLIFFFCVNYTNDVNFQSYISRYEWLVNQEKHIKNSDEQIQNIRQCRYSNKKYIHN